MARVIYWFRTDLRLHDSPALKAALDLDPEVLWPVFTWDPHYVYKARGGLNRWQFLLDCQTDLSNSISKLNKNSKLFVLRESPQTLLAKICIAWKVTHLVFEKDTDTYPRERDHDVVESVKKLGIEVIVCPGRTLWDSEEIVKKNDNKPTMSISQLQAAADKIGTVAKPISSPSYLPDPGDMPLDFEQDPRNNDPDLNAPCRATADNSYSNIAGPKGDFSVGTMEEIGFPSATTPYRGGEAKALKVLDHLVKSKKYTATFEKPNTSPADYDPPSTTLLSPFLHFGALSVREFYWRVRDTMDQYEGSASKPPASLTGQLMFREMYFAAQASIGRPFGQTVTNPHVRFIPWNLRSKKDSSTGLVTGDYHVDSEESEIWLQRWKQGVTGFPWIDALMRQLRHDGWMHHLGRHSVACFLTRGGCYVDWERGAEVFEEYLLDHEPACNAGNWQWVSCAAFFAQYYRCYSPVSFPKKWDKQGNFVRHWIPALKDLPAKYIYEPWKAPMQDQKKASVRIQGDGLHEQEKQSYPKPMFDFDERKRKCILQMKAAYSKGLHGNDKSVLDGAWRKQFYDSDHHVMQSSLNAQDNTELRRSKLDKSRPKAKQALQSQERDSRLSKIQKK